MLCWVPSASAVPVGVPAALDPGELDRAPAGRPQPAQPVIVPAQLPVPEQLDHAAELPVGRGQRELPAPWSSGSRIRKLIAAVVGGRVQVLKLAHLPGQRRRTGTRWPARSSTRGCRSPRQEPASSRQPSQPNGYPSRGAEVGLAAQRAQVEQRRFLDRWRSGRWTRTRTRTAAVAASSSASRGACCGEHVPGVGAQRGVVVADGLRARPRRAGPAARQPRTAGWGSASRAGTSPRLGRPAAATRRRARACPATAARGRWAPTAPSPNIPAAGCAGARRKPSPHREQALVPLAHAPDGPVQVSVAQRGGGDRAPFLVPGVHGLRRTAARRPARPPTGHATSGGWAGPRRARACPVIASTENITSASSGWLAREVNATRNTASGSPLASASPGDQRVDTPSTRRLDREARIGQHDPAERVAGLERALGEPRQPGQRRRRPLPALAPPRRTARPRGSAPAGGQAVPDHLAGEEGERRDQPLGRVVLQLPVAELAAAAEPHRPGADPAQRQRDPDPVSARYSDAPPARSLAVNVVPLQPTSPAC